MDFRHLTPAEIAALEARGCSATEWADVLVDAGEFDPSRLRNVRFSGTVHIGATCGEFELQVGFCVKAGIYDATLHNCTIGRGVYINRIANFIANYEIADGAFIENVDKIAATGNSTFGVGTRVSVLNETGGREVPVYPGLSAQLAYVIAMYRHDDALIKRLYALIDAEAEALRGLPGRIGSNARIVNSGELLNVMVGNHAAIEGATRLHEGTIAGSVADPVHVGAGVIAENFIFCSGARVDDGAIVMNSFVGQACSINHLFSAHDSLFFSNCVCENGEAAAIFAGPYTVTMHKSSLLIAGMFSFLNAGSGSNQSNHMYKLGPVHQGVIGRGSKTASDSYVLWPARIGEFSVVLGRHVNHPDTSNLPFSYLIENYGRSFLVPGVNIKSVGTVRDARKWPQRDKRRDPNRLDRINFNLLSPYTAGKMFGGIETLNDIERTEGITAQTYTYRGMTIEPRALSKGREYYGMALDKFMGNSIIHRLSQADCSSDQAIRQALEPTHPAGRGPWVDMAGMIAPAEEIDRLCGGIVSGSLGSLTEIESEFTRLANDYYEMEWTWVYDHFEQWYGTPCNRLTTANITDIVLRWRDSVVKLDRMLYADAYKDFSRVAQIGFGVDGSDAMATDDFRNVRGDFDNDPFVRMVLDHITTKSALGDEILRKVNNE